MADSNYHQGFAKTYDNKGSSKLHSHGNLVSASAASLGNNYAVPSSEKGRLLLAIPMKLALKYKPPTIAVVYQMKDSRSSNIGKKPKKYIHEIKINFERKQEPIDI